MLEAMALVMSRVVVMTTMRVVGVVGVERNLGPVEVVVSWFAGYQDGVTHSLGLILFHTQTFRLKYLVSSTLLRGGAGG